MRTIPRLLSLVLAAAKQASRREMQRAEHAGSVFLQTGEAACVLWSYILLLFVKMHSEADCLREIEHPSDQMVEDTKWFLRRMPRKLVDRCP